LWIDIVKSLFYPWVEKKKALRVGMFWLFSFAHWSLKNYSRVYRSFFLYSKNIILPLKSTKLRVVDIFNIHIKLKYDFCLRKDKKKIRFVFGRIFVLSHRFFWWLQGSSGVYHSDGTSDVGLLPNLTFHRLFKWAIMSSSTWCNT